VAVIGAVVIVAADHPTQRPHRTAGEIATKATATTRREAALKRCNDVPLTEVVLCDTQAESTLRKQGQGGRVLVSRQSKLERWIGTHTEVNPGSAIQFVSADDGWRLDGVYSAPWLDDNLTTGPGGSELDWPARSVSKTTDGGGSWTKVIALADGIWGLDFQSPRDGWIVGVDALLRTTNGGGTWKRMPEPELGPLVSVQFTTLANGLGITTGGSVVKTDDGGSTWVRTGLTASVDTICTTPASIAYAASGDGALYLSRGGGDDWQQIEPAHEPKGEIASPYLACSGSTGVLGILDLGKAEAGTSESYEVEQGGTSGGPWRATLTGSDPPTVRNASSHQPPAIATLAGVAEGLGGAIVVGLPQTGLDVATQRLRTGGTSASATGVVSAPSLLPMPWSRDRTDLTALPEDFLRVLGVSFIGNYGWLYVVDGAVDGASPKYRTIVAATTDNEAQWHIVSESPVEYQPQYK
jgi:hypothetical protein